MTRKIKLSVLDQSIVRQGSTAREAIEETIATAKLAEALGYERFWISEHHNAASIAGSAPEVLMVKLADETDHIRIGSGGIMLPNHSALKWLKISGCWRRFFRAASIWVWDAHRVVTG